MRLSNYDSLLGWNTVLLILFKSLSEEEHQEYDIPRNVNNALKAKFEHVSEENDDDDDDDPLVNNSEENLYENQAYQDSIHKKEDNIYANESVVTHTTLSELSVASSTHTDDSRSSGYRSSSSPSIQSEELYVNESAIGKKKLLKKTLSAYEIFSRKMSFHFCFRINGGFV